MFGNLFGPKQPKPAQHKAVHKGPRVNLERRFSIIAEIGQGSMSRVFRATDLENGRVVCLKVQDQNKTAAALARSGLSLTGAISEGSIGQKIIHPNVVRTYGHGVSTRGDHFIFMELIDGQSLSFVRQSQSSSLQEKLRLLIQSAAGLAAVHQAGFVHHDFGPKNVMVNRESVVKIIDFGLTVPNLPAFNRPGNRTGTVAYMAPELIRREETSEKIDIFSYGIMAYELLSGRMPYDATDTMALMRMRMNTDPIDLAQFCPDLPDPLLEIIRQSIQRRPRDRWPDMASLAEALQVVHDALEPPAPTPEPRRRAKRPRPAEAAPEPQPQSFEFPWDP